MKRSPLSRGLSQRRLRWGLALFVIALSLPVSLMLIQAWQQLQWETLHRYREQARELSIRIDQQLRSWLVNEEQRAFTDYQFLNVSGTAALNLVQRSPLSNWPVTSEWPGALGFFQVDGDGRFSTPLLPQSDSALATISFPAIELQQRRQRQDTLRDILSRPPVTAPAPEISAEPAFSDRDQVGVMAEEIAAPAESPAPSTLPASDDHALVATNNHADNYVDTRQFAEEPSLAATKEPSAPERQRGKQQERRAEPTMADLAGAASPAAPQRGNADDAIETEAAVIATAARPPQRQQSTDSEADESLLDYSLRSRQDQPRLEKSQSIETTADALLNVKRSATTDKLEAADASDDIRIHSFDSVVDPFRFRYLQSGHFMLYRPVWRDGQRYFQGLLIDSDTLIERAVAEPFRRTNLARTGNLRLTYREQPLTTISGIASRGYSSTTTLTGETLFNTPLSAPLSDLQLQFLVGDLPPGPGARLLGWVGLLFLVVLFAGCWLMYRAGLRQIALHRQQQDFVAAVSHELRTPLTSIRMYGEMLTAGWVSADKAREYHQYIHDESERLSRLIDNVLQLARMSRQELQLQLKPVSIATIIDLLRSKIEPSVIQAGFEFELNSPEELADRQINIDLDALTQIIINLVDNAIKFSAHAERQRVEIYIETQGADHIALKVRDHGPGIARDQMKKIFQLFYRSENELTRETVGTGIGLALVQQLAVAMHCQVSVSNHRTGALFSLTVPRTV
ncbi:MAG: hypothetical protein Tsb002_19140 [Wenzhouxiangellaceae bacterium]